MQKVNELKGYEDVLDIYYFDGSGKVYSEHKKGYLKEMDNGNGYKGYRLKKKNERKWIIAYTHRLMALTFIPNPQNKPQVNHIDENKGNNSLSNLEWVTRLENVRHGTGIKRSKISKGYKTYVYDYMLNFISKYDTVGDATKDILGYRDTSVADKRCNDFYFLTAPIELLNLKSLNTFNSQTLVLENITTGTKEVFPNQLSLKEVFPTSNISNAVNNRYTLRKDNNKYKIYPIDFTTLKDSPNLYKKQV